MIYVTFSKSRVIHGDTGKIEALGPTFIEHRMYVIERLEIIIIISSARLCVPIFISNLKDMLGDMYIIIGRHQ